MSLGLRKGDKVIVIAGKSKGKSGKVLKTMAKQKRVVVEGANLVKKHLRRRSENEPGGIKEIPSSIHISNVAILCANCNRGVRFAIKVSKNKNKVRICSKCKKPI